ncbi:MAG: DHHA1 domain-containing protein [Chloroflexi bacterium]|nr:DHHA1 domain-containing protein [Chloroflexota bacterium]
MIASATAPEGFDDEISSVVHRLRDTLGPAGLFVLVQVGQDVQLVARSSRDAVDVALVAKALGGGGHSRAAAAMVVERPLSAVIEELEKLLPEAVAPQARVAQNHVLWRANASADDNRAAGGRSHAALWV